MSELDMERSNVLNFVTDGSIERICSNRKRREDGLRENFRRDADRAKDYAEEAMDHCRDMQRAGFDTAYELQQMETWAKAFLLAVQTAQLTTKRLSKA